jgi:glyoxylate/hydroxypyruvate reductase
VSILGFGRIAQRALSLLIPFGVRRALYATSKPGQRASSDYFNLLDGKNPLGVPVEPAKNLDELFAEADILIVLASYNPSTHHIVNEDNLKKMKKTAVVVNAGRGSVLLLPLPSFRSSTVWLICYNPHSALIDSDALSRALQAGDLFGAGLDVLENEPNIPSDHPLVQEKKCFILPHIGSATYETRTGMAKMSVQNLIAGLQGGQMVAEKKLD